MTSSIATLIRALCSLLAILALTPLVDAQSTGLRIPSGSNLSFPHDPVMSTTVPVTIESWVSGDPGSADIRVFQRYQGSAEHKELGVFADGRIFWQYAGQPWGSGGSCIETAPGVFPHDGQFHHLAFVRRVDGTWETYLDGMSVQVGGPAGCCWLTCTTINGTPPTTIPGGDGSTLRAVRVSNVERYVGNFIPAASWSPDPNTVLLVPFTEGTGNLVADDGTANQVGTITGPYQWMSLDCNGNGVTDDLDITNGTSLDQNQDGVPDECQNGTICVANLNTSGQGATLAGSSLGSGIGSGLHLECTSGPAGQYGFFLASAGGSSNTTVLNGALCIDQPIGRYNSQMATNQGLATLNSIGVFDAAGVLQSISGNGTSAAGSGFDVPLELPFTQPVQQVLPGSTWYFQCWFRDGASANFSDVVGVTFP
jgi:hypothetical protein